MVKPNGYDCSGCSEWDDVNGCWSNVKQLGEQPCSEHLNLDEEYGDE